MKYEIVNKKYASCYKRLTDVVMDRIIDLKDLGLTNKEVSESLKAEKATDKNGKSLNAAAICGALIATGFNNGSTHKKKKSSSKKTKNDTDLKQENIKLKERIKDLENEISDFMSLDEDYKTLESDFNRLVTDNDNLENKVHTLKAMFDTQLDLTKTYIESI